MTITLQSSKWLLNLIKIRIVLSLVKHAGGPSWLSIISTVHASFFSQKKKKNRGTEYRLWGWGREEGVCLFSKPVT